MKPSNHLASYLFLEPWFWRYHQVPYVKSPTPYDHQVLVPDDAAYEQVLSHGFILAVPGRDIRPPAVVFKLSTPLSATMLSTAILTLHLGR